MKTKSKSKFNDKWLNDASCSLCLQRGQTNEEAKCILCSVTLGLWAVGSGALDSHAKGKKQNDLLKFWT